MRHPVCLMILASAVAFGLSMGNAATIPAAKESRQVSQGDSDYPNGELLVSTAWLGKNLEAKNLVIVDALGRGYEKKHIGGAVGLNHLDKAGGFPQPRFSN